MKRNQKKRAPVAGTTGTPQNAVAASISDTYFRSGMQCKPIELVTVPRVWIESTIEMLIDAIDHSDRRELPEDSL